MGVVSTEPAEGMSKYFWRGIECRLCTNILHYAPTRIVQQQAAALDAALHTLRRHYSSDGSMEGH